MEIQPIFTIGSSSVSIDAKQLKSFSSDGYNRSHSELKLIKATTDAQAISAFLNEYKDSPHTLISYAKEIERLLLWCVHVAKIGISDINRDHIVEYQEFISNPTPQKKWCGSKASRYKKDGEINPEWRPFFCGLSDASLKVSLKILDSFFNYLVEMHYLQGNPVAMNRRRKKKSNAGARLVERYLEMDELISVLDALDNYPVRKDSDAFRVARARYIILLLFYSGMRISEASHHTMGNFIQRDKCWFLSIIGKGKKPRDIPVPDELLKALAVFRELINLPSSEPTFKEHTPLVPNIGLNETLQTRRIDQIVKWAFHLGADLIENKSPHKASKLRQASAHWLRHSYVTYLLDSGAPLKVAQENAGHSNISTTMLYRHVSQTNRHTATRHLSIDDANKDSKQITANKINDADALMADFIKKTKFTKSDKKITVLGNDDDTEKTITLKMHFFVENNSEFVRGKGKSLKEIDRYVFSEYDIKIIDLDCADYEITLPYTTYKSLDDTIEEIQDEACQIADSRNCWIEFDVYTFDGDKSFPFAEWD